MTTATTDPKQPVRLHNPKCPNVDSGVPAVAEWTATQVDDLVAGSALFDSCGFCRAMFPPAAPDYSPPAPFTVAPEGGTSDVRD
jgi:hypothetical protein